MAFFRHQPQPPAFDVPLPAGDHDIDIARLSREWLAATAPKPQPKPAPASSHRPTRFADIVGQQRLTQRLTIHLEAAVARGDQPGHVLLDGGPGLGKTTYAKAIAGELSARGMRSAIHETTADAVPTVAKLAVELSTVQAGDVVFLDEIHALPRDVQLAMLRVLEDGELFVAGGSRAAAQRVSLPRFTLVGATTDPGKLSAPLRDRFKFVGHLESYSTADLQLLVHRHAHRVGIAVTVEATAVIAKACRRTPRRAIRLLESCRDFAYGTTGDPNTRVTSELAKAGLAFAEVDENGLDNRDRQYLRLLCVTRKGAPTAEDLICGSLDVDRATLRTIEPWLVGEGYVQRWPKGRVATKAGYRAVGVLVNPLAPGD
jgi:Holliday junction DNA helicase RuvB